MGFKIFGAGGRTRTDTSGGHGILSAARLPIPSHRHFIYSYFPACKLKNISITFYHNKSILSITFLNKNFILSGIFNEILTDSQEA